MTTLRKRLACLNYRLAEEMTVTVTRKLVRAYTPRIQAALKAVDKARLAGKLLADDEAAMNSPYDGEPDQRVLHPIVLAVARAEFKALDWRMDYLFDVVRADLGPRIARELANEFGWAGFTVE